jgi:hypothetical protein
VIGWVGSAALAGTAIQGSGSALAPACLDDEVCAQDAADLFRAAGMAAEPAALGISPAVVRGRGVSLEASAQSVPGFLPPAGVDVLPFVPRLGLGGTGGTRTRWGGGIEVGGAPPSDGVDLGFTAAGRFGFAVASPDEREWVGLEVDGGYGLVQGVLFDHVDQAAVDLGVDPEALPRCGYPCTDALNLVHAGIDGVIAADVDPTAVVVVRLGGAYERQALDLALDGSTWSWSGLVPRATFGAAYRWGSQGLLGAAIRLGLAPPGPFSNLGRVPWSATLSGAWRFGPDEPVSTRIVPTLAQDEPAPAPAPAPVAPIPTVRRVSHPDLDCGPDRIPTGDPPPSGTEAWCVAIDDATHRVVLDGPYLKWYDADHIEQRGQNADDQHVGTWVHYGPDGTIDTVGDYADGVPNGTWRTYYPSGAVRSEMTWVDGRQTGESRDWGPDGRTCVVGQWLNGQRNGDWLEYVDNQLVHQRTYRSGVLVAEQRYAN